MDGAEEWELPESAARIRRVSPGQACAHAALSCPDSNGTGLELRATVDSLAVVCSAFLSLFLHLYLCLSLSVRLVPFMVLLLVSGSDPPGHLLKQRCSEQELVGGLRASGRTSLMPRLRNALGQT